MTSTDGAWSETTPPQAATHLLIERVEEDGRLDRLTQTHLVGQDGVGALSPGEAQPVEPLQLVGVQRPPRAVQVLRLTLKLYGGLEEKTGGGVSWWVLAEVPVRVER